MQFDNFLIPYYHIDRQWRYVGFSSSLKWLKSNQRKFNVFNKRQAKGLEIMVFGYCLIVLIHLNWRQHA